MTRAHSPWVVLKFGGTSVSTLPNWKNIASIVKKRSAAGAPVLVVHSAVTKVTDMLEKLLEAALQQKHEEAVAVIEKRHRDLAAELGIGVSPELEKYFSELRQIAAGVALVGEVSDKTRARLMANGELMATELGGRFLASQGINVKWADARTLLKAEERKGASAKASLLSATCNFAPDAAMQKRLTELAPVVITQGFIASDEDGNTVLLGRGGSDTSAAYLAAKLNASRLEIWTDVPGMFSANPRSTPTARMLKALHYDEAQEIASNGAKVLHPRCILPARQYDIPLYVLATQTPDLEGTLVTSEGADGAAQVKAVAIKKGITLVSMESPGMWHQVGFVADAFQVFKAHGMSVDLISTSETNVTVSLDPQANSLDGHLLDALVADLAKLCRVEVLGPCASVSLLGRNIRAILHKLGEALELFAEQKIYLVSQAANDLNFTFVIDEDQGDRLVEQLHEMLIRPVPGDRVLGPTWEQLFAKPDSASSAIAKPWWHGKREQLVGLLKDKHSAYVYDVASVVAAARAVRGIKSISRVHYAMKANPHPDLLRALYDEGVHPECVSRGEVERVYAAIPNADRKHILFTPNFAPRDEYVWAFEQGVQVTVDNAYVVENWPAVFKGREIFVRVDTGTGRGHHSHVRTAGTHSKFGVPLAELPALAKSVQKARRQGRRPACPHGQRRVRRAELGRDGDAAHRPHRAVPRCTRGGRRRRPRRAGACRTAGTRPREARCRARQGDSGIPEDRAVDGARALFRGVGGRAHRARHAAQVQGRPHATWASRPE